MEAQRRTSYRTPCLVHHHGRKPRQPGHHKHPIRCGIDHLLSRGTPPRLHHVHPPRRHHPFHTATHKRPRRRRNPVVHIRTTFGLASSTFRLNSFQIHHSLLRPHRSIGILNHHTAAKVASARGIVVSHLTARPPNRHRRLRALTGL